MSDLILASASPRRLELLRQLGYAPTVCIPHVDETPLPGESPSVLVRRLAGEKARAVGQQHPKATVLGADTIVTVEGKIFGKAVDLDSAEAFYQALGGRWHQVLTAVAVLQPTSGRLRVRLSRNAVFMRPLSPKEVRAYWETGEPLDKAGGYAIQGLGAAFIHGLRGSYSGVMGLPLAETAGLLEAAGLPPLFLQDAHE